MVVSISDKTRIENYFILCYSNQGTRTSTSTFLVTCFWISKQYSELNKKQYQQVHLLSEMDLNLILKFHNDTTSIDSKT